MYRCRMYISLASWFEFLNLPFVLRLTWFLSGMSGAEVFYPEALLCSVDGRLTPCVPLMLFSSLVTVPISLGGVSFSPSAIFLLILFLKRCT